MLRSDGPERLLTLTMTRQCMLSYLPRGMPQSHTLCVTLCVTLCITLCAVLLLNFKLRAVSSPQLAITCCAYLPATTYHPQHHVLSFHHAIAITHTRRSKDCCLLLAFAYFIEIRFCCHAYISADIHQKCPDRLHSKHAPHKNAATYARSSYKLLQAQAACIQS